MTKIRSTKTALVASVILLALTFSMFVGTTFAWFTDSVKSDGNIIKTGNLDVEMYWADGKEDPDAADWADASQTAIFKYDNWEPGYVQVRHVKIANLGSLALKYQVSIVANGEVSKLSDVIDVYYLDPAAAISSRTALSEDMKIGNLTSVLANIGTSGYGELEAGKSDVITIALKMREDAGNEYMNLAIGTSFSVVLLATQNTVEADSFGNDYDEGAIYLENASASVDVPEIATESKTLSVDKSGVSVEVPAAILNMLPDDVKSISIGHSDPKVVGNIVTFDSIEVFDQNGNVVDLAAIDSGAKVTVTLPIAFADGTEVIIYHDGERIATATVTNGFVSYEAAHFCEVEVSDAKNEYDYVVNTLDELKTAFAAEGSVRVMLASDIEFERIVSVNPGADVYLDMNGKTITVDSNTTSNTLIYIMQGAKLVIDGNGTIDLKSVSTMAMFAPYGTLVIENGTFIRDKIETVTDKTAVLFMGAKVTTSDVTINGGYFDGGYYDPNVKSFEETAADVNNRGKSGDTNAYRTAVKDNISVLLNHSGYGSFKVYGGTFVGGNPAWGDEGCMMPTNPDYLRPWSYYQGALLDGQVYNADKIVIPAGYSITESVNENGVPVYTVSYSK